jgi:NTE family protein
VLINNIGSHSWGTPALVDTVLRGGLALIAAVMAIFAGSCSHQPVRPPARPLKVAVVLGAGAARGFAHIGVLKVLETNKVPVDMIVGTSAGSFVGSLYAYGHDAFQLQKIALSIEKGDIIDMAIPDNGFIKGEKLEEYVNRMVNNTPIEKMKIPFFAVATSIPSGQEVVFGKGNTGAAVRASCSIPGIFRPMKIADRMYIDGGVVSPVAVDAARRYGADIVIAVDISADLDVKQPEGTIDTILQAITIMYAKLSGIQLARADIVIKPKVGYIGSDDFDKRHEAILEGEKATVEAMPKIKALLERIGRQQPPAQ